MGRVYLARSPGFRLAALKVIHREYAKDPEFRERFRQEATAIGSVGEFCTTPMIDADFGAEQPWLATGYFPAPSLEEFVDRSGPMEEPELRALGAGLAEALSAIHEAGFIHRDLHPANVLLTREGPQIIDFGISKAQDTTRLTRTGAMIGTPGYMSPEQIVRERSSDQATAIPGSDSPAICFHWAVYSPSPPRDRTRSAPEMPGPACAVRCTRSQVWRVCRTHSVRSSQPVSTKIPRAGRAWPTCSRSSRPSIRRLFRPRGCGASSRRMSNGRTSSAEAPSISYRRKARRRVLPGRAVRATEFVRRIPPRGRTGAPAWPGS